MSDDAFEEKVGIYDALIDWDRRLTREAPFYRGLFESCSAASVLDTACGTGRHAEMFHAWGLRVEGADVSPAMIAACRQRVGEPSNLRWVERSFTEPAADRFDAVICVGNSLALANDPALVASAVGAMMASCRAGGVCIIQVLNLWAIPQGQTVWQKIKRVSVDGEDHVLLKCLHRVADRAYVDLVDLELEDQALSSHVQQASFAGLEADALVALAHESGAGDVQVYGDYERQPYQVESSTDLIMVARRS